MITSVAWLYVPLAALFGLVIGSFLNVCIYRIVRDQSVITPRSYCPGCGADIAWFDNIPVISFFQLHGRCRHCQNRISIRYPIVELLTALIYTLLASRYGVHIASLKWIVFESILIILSFTDLEERILPDEITIGGTVLGLAFAAVVPLLGVLSELFFPHAHVVVRSIIEAVSSAMLLALPIWGLAALWSRLRGKQMMGLGDVKMLPLLGSFLGLENAVSALLVGSVSGILLGGGYILATRKKMGSYELPLGTFFCLGAGLLPLIHSL